MLGTIYSKQVMSSGATSPYGLMQKRRYPYTGLRCNDCHRFFEGRKPMGKCPTCDGLLDTVFDEETLAEFPLRKPVNADRSMWRYNMFLPVQSARHLVSAGEGGTQLRRMRTWRTKVWAKDETRNPTGTFKDRGASAAITCLSQLKVPRVVLASEGNAGCSFALYSNLSGINCHVYLPKQANPAKLDLTRRLRAKVTRVEGTISDAGRHAAETAKKTRCYNASTFAT